MKWKTVLLCTAFAVVIGGGIFMNAGFAENHYTLKTPPEPCICSSPSDLAIRVNRNDRYESSLKAHLEPSFQMSLWNCQCGSLSCVVSAQAVSCLK